VAEPRDSAFVERLDRDPIGHPGVEWVELLLERGSISDLVGPDLVRQCEPVGADSMM